MRKRCSIAGVPIFAATACALGSPPQPEAAEVPAIRLSTTNPMGFVYLEHEGPYWSTGPLFTAVRELMADRGQNGALCVWFENDPTTVSASQLRSQVGFLTDSEWTPDRPFARREVPQIPMVSTEIEGTFGASTKLYPVLRAWAAQRGFEPSGGVMELYRSPTPGAKTRGFRTEIQMLVVEKKAPVPIKLPPPPDAPTVVHAAPSREPPAEAEPKPENTAMSRPMAELVAAGEFERAAVQVIPDRVSGSAPLRIWIGQIVFRIGAVTKGLEQQAQDAADLSRLSQTLVTRYRAVCGASSNAALQQAVVRVDSRGDPSAEHKRKIMRELDRLLGRVATKSMPLDDVRAELLRVLQAVQDVVLQSPL